MRTPVVSCARRVVLDPDDRSTWFVRDPPRDSRRSAQGRAVSCTMSIVDRRITILRSASRITAHRVDLLFVRRSPVVRSTIGRFFAIDISPQTGFDGFMQTWLSRASFSFNIIGLFLSWEAYQGAIGQGGPVSTSRILLYAVGAMFSYVLGFAGVRQRHRRDRD